MRKGTPVLLDGKREDYGVWKVAEVKADGWVMIELIEDSGVSHLSQCRAERLTPLLGAA